jgi:hypothetical protein
MEPAGSQALIRPSSRPPNFFILLEKRTYHENAVIGMLINGLHQPQRGF